MKLLIDIPYEIVETIQESNVGNFVYKAIKNGTPLPKRHGRLIDADQTLATAWLNFYEHEDKWQKRDSNYVPLGRFYDQNGFECCQQAIVNAPTIIEADRYRDCKTCGNSNNGKCAGTEECHECMWESKYIKIEKENTNDRY